MFEHANYALSFNMAGNFPQPKNKKDSKIFYANALNILNFCFTAQISTIRATRAKAPAK